MNYSEEDLRRYFLGTWVGFRGKHGLKGWVVTDISGTNLRLLRGRTARDVPYTDPGLVLDHPDTGIVVEDTPYFVDRLPARQWKKAVCNGTLQITALEAGEVIDPSDALFKRIVDKLYTNEVSSTCTYNGKHYYKDSEVDLESAPRYIKQQFED